MRMRESCQRLLKSNPELASAKNYVDLANSLLDLGIRKATDGQVYISNFNKKNQHRALQRCATTLYPESIQLFKKAKANLVKDPKAANSDALDAGLRTHECTTVIVFDNINVPGTIVDINNNVFFLGEIASYAASMLLK
ncbi:unnamed protein product [Lupinus luteus]|uniref:Uncharacterized protein n=1 Tax=Lupinus luteus TaxID=3873 RepID=A0AAV1XWJ5_LUPLU